MTRCLNVVFSGFFLLICTAESYAGTILSSKGLGSPLFLPNARSIAMGGLSIAVPYPVAPSRINPAMNAGITTTRISIQHLYENNRYEDPEGKASSLYSNLYGFMFAIPFGSGLGMTLGLTPVTRMDFNIAFREELAGEAYTKSIEGQGGLNQFSFSAYWGVFSKLSLGVTGHYLFGNLEEEWTVDYDSFDFETSTEVFETHTKGFGMTLGIGFRPINALLLGATYTTEIAADMTTITQHRAVADSDTSTGSFRFPAHWGIGVTYSYKDAVLLGFEYSHRNWENLKINAYALENVRSTPVFSTGMEVQATTNPMETYLKRIAYRIGFSYQPYYSLDPDGNTLNEYWFTFGLGFPFFMNAAQVDMAVSFGKRGSIADNELSENLIRLSLTVSGSEKWFIRRF